MASASLDDVLYDENGEVQYAYFRMSNMDSIAEVYASDYTDYDSSVSAWKADWNMTYSIFDSPGEVHVTRYDVAYTDGKYTRIGGAEKFIKLTGAAFFFTSGAGVYLEDMSSGTYSDSFASDSMAAVSAGSCIGINMGASATEGANASVLVVTQGKFEEVFGDDVDASNCSAASFLVGTDDLHNNPVDYDVSGTCDSKLAGPGGAEDYDDLDAPIGPLQAHYHTRGALCTSPAPRVSSFSSLASPPVSQ